MLFNATLAFAVASAPSSLTVDSSNIEPPVLTNTQLYSYNMLLLNNESTAILDLPQPGYITAVQSLLAVGKSRNEQAPVLAVVANFNRSKNKIRKDGM
jgi:hypothetical protein